MVRDSFYLGSAGAAVEYGRQVHTLDHADLLISGGTIVDGLGAPGRPGTVAVVDGRIRVLASTDPLPAHVGRTIDATGKVVAPGFIDLHSHGGLMILADGRHEPKVRQGVTTELSIANPFAKAVLPAASQKLCRSPAKPQE